ncbi:MAG: DNA polymerase I [Candidatus Omnitrophica bacterium]|nr:DNA polymerase I [Candidatus Omnitrophota bacterium]
MKRLFLIDGNSFCYRAYYAIRELRTREGVPTNAIYGFFTMLRKLLNDEAPDYIGCAFDLKGPTFRHKAYEDYKSHRKPMPDELVMQLDAIKELLAILRIPIFEKEGFEADDVLATLATRFASRTLEVFIVTGDKDMLQLVNTKIKIYNTHKEGLIYDEEAVREHFGVEPAQIVELIALAGDPSDNIRGVSGIGQTTAAKLIGEFRSLEHLYSNLDAVRSDSLREKLKKSRDDAWLSRELATCDTGVDIAVDLEAMRCQEPCMEELVPFLKRFEFRSLLKEYISEGAGGKTAAYTVCASEKELEALIKTLKKKKEFAFDFETTSADPMQAELVGISFSFQEGQAHYVPVKGPGEQDPSHYIFDVRRVLDFLRDILEDEQIRKIGQNIKYEEVVLKNYGIKLRGIAFDTMVASYLLNPNKANHNLDDMALEHLGYKKISITSLIGKGKQQTTMDAVEVERVAEYACEDSDMTLRLKHVFEPLLKKYRLDSLFETIEMPLVPVLSAMELEGVAIDTRELKRLSGKVEKGLETLTFRIYRQAGEEFNINSPKQLGVILFEKLGLPVVKRTKTGFSTDIEVLEALADAHPLPRLMLEYRELAKIKTTYIDGFLKLMNPRTKRIHTSFNQTVTATGRLSSSQPNLQNIPIRTELGREIRRLFVPREKDWLILSADYSQIELRVLAHLSGDAALIKAFQEGKDIHRRTASLIFNCPEKEVTARMREEAKTVNFGIIYGMSPYGLSRDLGIEVGRAKQFINAYFNRYAGVHTYIARCVEDAKKTGFISTLFQRRRYIPELKSPDHAVQQFGERAAINTPIQGTASDLIKKAMIAIYQALREEPVSCRMVLQVHDELVFEVHKKDVAGLARLVKEEMEGVERLRVPLLVKVQAGANWLDVEPVEI